MRWPVKVTREAIFLTHEVNLLSLSLNRPSPLRNLSFRRRLT